MQQKRDHLRADPDRWRDDLKGEERLRFVINVLTRLRVCAPDGRFDLTMKGEPPPPPPPLLPWFELERRQSRDARIIFGHWSALGFVRRDGVVGMDTGCVWGGALTAFDLDRERAPISLACGAHQLIGAA